MATTISTQDIVDVKTDIDHIGDTVNENMIINPRYGEPFKSLPMIAAESEAALNNFESTAQDKANEWDSAINLITQEGGVPALAVSTAGGENQQDINDYNGAKWRNKAGGYSQNARVMLENGDIVRSTVANNTNNPNVDMIGWVKQKQFKTIRDFNNDFVKAGDWIKESTANYVELFAETYELNTVGTLYFNRYVCRNGRAIVKLSSATSLRYINKTDGSEVVDMYGFDLLVEGHRGNSSERNLENMVFPYSQGATPVKSANIRNINVRGLTNINDIDSWSDDAGQSRCVGFINLTVNEISYIGDIFHYGLGTFATIKSNNAQARHEEKNIIGFNCETNIYNPVSDFSFGESVNIKIYNTPAQKAYWLNKNAGTLNNGKNCVMCEADHSEHHLIKGCGGKYIIERSVYNTSRDTILEDCDDEGSATSAVIKHTKTTTPSGRARGKNIRAKNITNTSAILDVYGFSEYELDGLDLQVDVKNPARPIYFTNIGTAKIKNGFIKNMGMPFYLTGDKNCTRIDISDFTMVNCNNAAEGSIWWRRSDATLTLQGLSLTNINYRIENIVPAELANVGMAFDGVVSVKLNNVECISRQSPFVKGGATTYLEAMDCNFMVISDTTYLNMWTALGGASAPYANKFDYTVSIESTVAAPQVAVKARFKKLNDSGLVKCHDYWSDIDFNYPVTVANGLGLLTIGDKSFKCIASFGQAQIEFVWDAVTRAITTQYNIGAVFSTTLTSDKINIYVDASNRFTINIGNGTWTGATGGLSVRVQRF